MGKHRYVYISLFLLLTLWNKSLCSSSEDMAFAALQLDSSLLGK